MSLLTYQEVADELAVSKRTVRRVVAAGQLRSVAVRGAKRIHRDDLDGYVKRLRAAGSPAAPPVQVRRQRARRDLSFRDKLRASA